jgi:hypothetical protein
LTVLRLETTRDGRRLWRCRCDCGRHKVVETRYLTTGATASCGCLRVDVKRAEMVARHAA